MGAQAGAQKVYEVQEEGVCIGEQGSDDDQFFADADALLKGFLIGEVVLESLWDRIVIEFSA